METKCELMNVGNDERYPDTILTNGVLVSFDSVKSSVTTSKGISIHVSGMHIRNTFPTEQLHTYVEKPGVRVLDLGGRYVLPGLCDAHVHVTATHSANLHNMAAIPMSLIAARSATSLLAMLHRGFTTVRDAGGCDWGLAKAVEEGSLVGPRILFCGHALSQTGGHGDMRYPGEENLPCHGHGCGCNSSLGRVCDGVAEVRRAARDELRKGAHFVKVMASGGVASPTDALTNLQFSREELCAMVEEASNAGSYVAAHAYSADAIKRAVSCGVRSVEHGNYLDMECAKLMASRNAFLVPTLVTYDRIQKDGMAAGMDSHLVAKVGDLLEKGLEAIKLAQLEGVTICFGSDLLGSMQKYQLEEFTIRASVQSPEEILRSCTVSAAALFGMESMIGSVKAGYLADLIVINGNPLENIELLTNPLNICLIMKEGQVISLSI